MIPLLVTFFVLLPSAQAAIDWENLISRSRELSMSGILGLVETDILFSQPGTEQQEHFRILQAFLGIGCLRVISKICKSPCFEFLHQMYGIKPPESVEAREFWLQQESWTELKRLNMSQEDTSYHRINQGSGPQAKILRTGLEIEEEKALWDSGSAEDKTPPGSFLEDSETIAFSQPFASNGNGANSRKSSDAATFKGFTQRKGGTRSATFSSLAGCPTAPATTTRISTDQDNADVDSNIYASCMATVVSEGTTDKWWMDRWQIEVLATASAHKGLTIAQAAAVLTEVYFGNSANKFWHCCLGLLCCVFTGGTFAAAWLTNWSWISQFIALSCLGYFVNRTSTLRAWCFNPNPHFRDVSPTLMSQWPSPEEIKEESIVVVRIANQSSGFCHLRGLVALPSDNIKKAEEYARGKKARYSYVQHKIPTYNKPYSDPTKDSDFEAAERRSKWLSYEAQSSFYGLVASISRDNVFVRSVSVILALVNGFFLLLLGFGGTVKEGWSQYVLAMYAGGILIAIAARGRTASWTMPEFEVIDLTTITLPAATRARLLHMKDLPDVLRDAIEAKEATEAERQEREEVAQTPVIVGQGGMNIV